ncbi:MAG: cytochrome c [Cryomorphaceae bacterium]|jgi:cytochrome c6|nr:cytochrome c [Cryomorphaceae bacterium]
MAFQNGVGRGLVLGACSLLLCVSCGSSTENEHGSNEKNEMLTGKALYLRHCAICHGGDGKLGASGAKDLSITKLDSLEISKMIIQGKNAMPPMIALLESDTNVAKVTSYVLKLKN